VPERCRGHRVASRSSEFHVSVSQSRAHAVVVAWASCHSHSHERCCSRAPESSGDFSNRMEGVTEL
jgi:Tfp pilus assembly protein FimT